MIKPKEKACKGTGSAKGYGCGKLTYHRVYGLGKMCCYSNWLLTSEAGRIKMHKAIFKASVPRLDMDKQIASEKERNSLSKEIMKTQTIVNKHIRNRDWGKNCVSQDIPFKEDFEAGHLFNKKNYNAIRFDLDNINGQSIYANRYLEGDFDNYLLNLEKRIGKARVEALKEKAHRCKSEIKKWTFHELKEIQKNIKEISKHL